MSEPPLAPYGGVPNPDQPGRPVAGATGYPPGSGYRPPLPATAPATAEYPPPPPYYSGPPAPGRPGPDAGAPPQRSRVSLVIGIVVAVLAAACLGGGAFVYLRAGGTVDQAKGTRVSAPAVVAGRRTLTNPAVQQGMAEVLRTVQGEVTNTTSSVAAAYGEPSAGNFVVLIAVSGLIVNPTTKVDEELTAVKASDPSFTMSTPTTIDPGPLGGAAKCAQVTAKDPGGKDAQDAVCVWADNGSGGVVIFHDKVVADIRSDFLTIRGQVERQG